MCPKVFYRAALLVVIPWFTQCTSNSLDELPPPLPVQAPVRAAVVDANLFKVGDDLELFVKEDPTLNGVYPVRDGGYIVVPRAGRLNVAGLTQQQAEPKVREFLQKSQLTQATVIVERRASGGAPSADGANGSGVEPVAKVLVYITGSVPRAGGHAIPVPPGKKVGVYETLLISGGFGKFAMKDKVEVFRFDKNGKRKRAIVDLRPIMTGQADDPPISEGDIINVPEKVFGF